MRNRRHASWQNDLDYGMMVFAQSGIYPTFWFQRRKWIKVRRELYYNKPDKSKLERFSLEQVALSFLLLLGGMVFGLIAHVVESCIFIVEQYAEKRLDFK